ncbi:secretory calcium-binding phosphoprotein 8 [Sparus aurata]|uniref:secretory calcium-binding phosphoprotein 8 n=1 Tax=Sparus aurata TaxID=8175 RepID=UPI0011C1BF58|nr:G8 domain-containing protein DDB_G0286311-like [Sparus aurata]
MNQSQMALLTSALVIVLLTTASAKPIRWRWHHDADIPDNYGKQGWLDRNSWWSWWCSDSSGYEDSSETERETDQSLESWESSESSESQSSEESSEEVLTTDPTTPAVSTTATSATTMGDGGVLSTEQTTMSSTTPNVTPPPGITTTPVCVTHLIPTTAPTTENRGDN